MMILGRLAAISPRSGADSVLLATAAGEVETGEEVVVEEAGEAVGVAAAALLTRETRQKSFEMGPMLGDNFDGDSPWVSSSDAGSTSPDLTGP